MHKEESTVEELKRTELETKAKRRSGSHSIPITVGNINGLILGSGAMARSRNIDEIQRLIEEGATPQQIIDELERYFKPATIQDYVRVALKYSKVRSDEE
jgi:hypothetical protein